MRIDFDEDAHAYTLDGAPVPSVTEIISGALDGAKKKSYPPGSAERGRNVHLACEYDDVGDLDDDTLDPSLAGYVAAWRRFKREYEPAWIGIEARVGSRTYSYAGTLDRLARIGVGAEHRVTLLDIKSGRETREHALQTAGYAIAYEETTGVRVERRGCVYLTRDGDVSVRWHGDEALDRAAFVACRTLFDWRKR